LIKILYGVGETGDRWHKRQVGVAFRLCIYCERNNGKVITKLKKEKNLIQEVASKFSSVTKYRINVLQLEK